MKEAIYVELKFHLCGPQIRYPDRPGPTITSRGIKRIVEIFEKFNILGELAFVGPSAVQLEEDYPEVVKKIKELKVPITYHGGAGHPEPSVAGRMRDTTKLSLDEAIVAEWEFETHWLQPNWHWEGNKVVLGNPEAGKPVPGKFGGFLAIEKVLGVIAMSMAGDWAGNLRLTPALKALGAGFYKPSSQPARSATQLLGLHESYIQLETGVPAKYFRKKPGIDAPMRAEPEEWLDRLATALPRDRPYYLYTMVHATHSMRFFDRFERLIDFIHKRKEDFKIVWLDPEAYQWRPENSPLEFFKKTYGVKTLEEVLEIPCPVEKIKEMWKGEKRSLEEIYHRTKDRIDRLFSRPAMKTAEHLRPSKRKLKKETVLEAANQLILNWPQEFSHDGDFPYPPEYVDLGADSLSLAEAFQAFVYSLEYYLDKGSLPEEVEVEDILGPIDYPMYDLEDEPKMDPRKLTGYNPREISEDKMPDPQLVNSQGLPSSGDYYIWMPVHTVLDDEDVMQAAWEAAKRIRKVGHIPGVVEIAIRSEESRHRHLLLKYKGKLNAAEFLYALAQEYRLTSMGKPGAVMAISMKMIKDQPCGLIAPYSPVGYKGTILGQYHRLEGFIWRARVSKTLLNKAWTYKPKT